MCRTAARRHIPFHPDHAGRTPLLLHRQPVHARQPRAARQHRRRRRRSDGRAVLAEVFPRRRDERPRLGPLRDQPPQRLGAPDRRQQHVRVQPRRACADPRQLRRGAVLRHRQRVGEQLGRSPERSAARGRHGHPLSDAGRAAAFRRRLAAQSDPRTPGQRQPADAAVAHAFQHRAGVLTMRRLTRILLWTAGALLTLVLLAGVVVETPYFKNWLRGVVIRQANQHLNGTLAIGQFGGNLLTGAELRDVAVTMDNEKVASIDTVKVHYSIPRLIRGGTTVDSLVLDRPVVIAHREGDKWQLARLVKPTSDNSKSTRMIAIRKIVINNGTVTIDKAQGTQKVDIPEKIDHVNTSLSFAYVPDSVTTAEIGNMSFVASNPSFELRQMAGKVAINQSDITITKFTVRTGESALYADGGIAQYKQTPTLAMQVAMTPLSLHEVHRLAPIVKDMDVTPTINVKLGGPTSKLATELSVKSNAGDLSFTGTVSVTPGPDRVYSGEVAVHHLDLAPFLQNAEQKSNINVYAKVDLRGPSGFETLRGSVAVDAPKIETHGYIVEGIRANAKIDGRRINFQSSELAYKSNTTAAGSVEFASDQRPETRFDLTGVVKDVGFAYLPTSMRIPPAETKLTANYHVKIVIPRKPGWHVDGDVRLATSTVAGVTIGDGSKATFLFEPNVVQYQADANVAAVDLERLGDQFNIMALQNPRYRTNLNGHVVAKVNGTAVEKMDMTASGALTDSSVFGGRIPELMFDSSLKDDTLHVKAAGQLEKINPAVAADKPSLDGSISANVDTELTPHHLSQGTDLNSFAAYATAEFGPSNIGKYGRSEEHTH